MIWERPADERSDAGTARSIRGVLLVGFGLVLVLWLASGANLVRRLSETEKRTSDINARFNRSEELLAIVRFEVQRGSIFVRDALLDVPRTAGYYHDELAQSQSATSRALNEYESLIDSHAERESFDQLRDEVRDDLGLPATLEWYLHGFATRTGITADLAQQGVEARLAAEIEVCLYRIAQEALTNVSRHAQAASCRVYLQRLPRTVLLTVEDDGTGFDVREVTASPHRRGIGLLGIQERAAGFGGSLRLESTPGKGTRTRLTVEVPALAPDNFAVT